MSVNFRYPNITSGSEKEQLAQIKSFLHQLVEQLNYAVPSSGGDASSQTYEVQGQEVSYYELQSLIIQELQQVKDLFDQLSSKMQSEYVKDDELDKKLDAALTDAKESGEFDGPAGPTGPTGPAGPAGYTPVKGQDYFTEAEVDAITDEVLQQVQTAAGIAADIVTQIGTVNGWTFKKWSSNSYEMFGEFTVTPTAASATAGSMLFQGDSGSTFGSVYASNEITLPTPFAIASAIVSGTASDQFEITSGGQGSTDATNSIGFILLRSKAFDSNTQITVRLHVTGTYNLGGTE